MTQAFEIMSTQPCSWVLSAGVFALLYRVEPESFRAPKGSKLVFWSVACAIVFVGAGAGLVASVFKTHGVLVSVTCVGVVAIGAGVGAVIEAHQAASLPAAVKLPEGVQ
jgi:hypothetical protein